VKKNKPIGRESFAREVRELAEELGTLSVRCQALAPMCPAINDGGDLSAALGEVSGVLADLSGRVRMGSVELRLPEGQGSTTPLLDAIDANAPDEPAAAAAPIEGGHVAAQAVAEQPPPIAEAPELANLDGKPWPIPTVVIMGAVPAWGEPGKFELFVTQADREGTTHRARFVVDQLAPTAGTYRFMIDYPTGFDLEAERPTVHVERPGGGKLAVSEWASRFACESLRAGLDRIDLAWAEVTAAPIAEPAPPAAPIAEAPAPSKPKRDRKAEAARRAAKGWRDTKRAAKPSAAVAELAKLPNARKHAAALNKLSDDELAEELKKAVRPAREPVIKANQIIRPPAASSLGTPEHLAAGTAAAAELAARTSARPRPAASKGNSSAGRSPTDEALYCACVPSNSAGVGAAVTRWADRRKTGLTDAELKEAIQEEFSRDDAIRRPPSSPMFAKIPTPDPTLYVGAPAITNRRPTLKADKLVERARKILGIPLPKAAKK
jgi:hypothetical protein